MRRALYILGQLNDLDVEWMIENGQRRKVRRGEVIIRQGKPSEHVFVTVEGAFSVLDDRKGGVELARMGIGEIVGEMSFIDAHPPSATVAAAEDGLVLALPRSTLAERLERDVAFAARFYRALAIFLSDRLRAARGTEMGAPDLEDDALQEDELDPNVLDNVHLAGARFDTIVKRMAGV